MYGSRFLGGTRKAMNFWNMVANKTLTLITNILFNAILSDMETCYKCFRREVVEGMEIKAHGFEFEPEFTAKVCVKASASLKFPFHIMGVNTMRGRRSNGPTRR